MSTSAAELHTCLLLRMAVPWEERAAAEEAEEARRVGAAWRNQATAPQPIFFRLLEVVLFDSKSPKPSMGLFTSRSGELLRRTTASLEVPMVRGRMAQVALGVFGHMNSCSMSGGGGGPISVAHFADGSQRELRAGMEDKAVTEGSVLDPCSH